MMVIERNIKIAEKGINEIISTIQFYKDYECKDTELSSIGAVQGHLKALETIEILENVLRMFDINSDEYQGNSVILLSD